MATSSLDLLDPGLAVEASLAGYPGRVSAIAGWDTGRVVLDEHMLYFILRGSVRMDADGSKRILGAGTCAIIPPATPFRMRWGEARQPTMLRCRLRIARGRSAVSACPGIVVRPRSWGLEPVMSLLIDEAAARLPQRAERMRALALVLLTGLARAADPGAGLDARQRAAVTEYVARHRGHGLHPRDLAEHVGLTLDYFTRQFRLAHGMAPRRWLVRERIRTACVLLAEGSAALDQIAASLGYADRKAFTRQFTQVMRMPPGRWRQRAVAAGQAVGETRDAGLRT